MLGVALFAVVWAMLRAPAAGQGPAPAVPPRAPVAPGSDPTDLDPWNAHKGDVISISGAAEDYSDVDFPVDRRSAYESTNHRWVDLSGEFRGRRVYLEVYRYPQPDLIGILDGRKLALSDVGAAEEQLVDIDNRQDASAFLTYEGKQWHWESSREVGYFENEAGNGEGLYRWLFREPDGSRLICIEKWEGEPFEVRIARRFNARDITVYRAA